MEIQQLFDEPTKAPTHPTIEGFTPGDPGGIKLDKPNFKPADPEFIAGDPGGVEISQATVEKQAVQDNIRGYLNTLDDPEEGDAKIKVSQYLSSALNIPFDSIYKDYESNITKILGRTYKPKEALTFITDQFTTENIGMKIAGLWSQIERTPGEDHSIVMDDIKRLEESRPPHDPYKHNILIDSTGIAAGMIPYIWEVGKYAIPGAVATVGAGLLTGGTGAVPAAAAVAKNVANLVSVWGKAASFSAGYKAANGMLFGSLMELKDDEGQGIEGGIARRISLAAGLPIAGLEAIGAEYILTGNSIFKSIIDKMGKKFLTETLEKTAAKTITSLTVRGAFSNAARAMAKQVGEGLLYEVALEELPQGLLEMQAVEFAKIFTNELEGTEFVKASPTEWKRMITDTVIQSTKGILMLQAPRTLMAGGGSLRAYNQRQKALEEGKAAPSPIDVDISEMEEEDFDFTIQTLIDEEKARTTEVLEISTSETNVVAKDQAGKSIGNVSYKVDNNTITISNVNIESSAAGMQMIGELQDKFPGRELKFDSKSDQANLIQRAVEDQTVEIQQINTQLDIYRNDIQLAEDHVKHLTETIADRKEADQTDEVTGEIESLRNDLKQTREEIKLRKEGVASLEESKKRFIPVTKKPIDMTSREYIERVERPAQASEQFIGTPEGQIFQTRIKQALPQFSQGEIESAAALIESRANKLGISPQEWLDRNFTPEVFGAEGYLKAELAQTDYEKTKAGVSFEDGKAIFHATEKSDFSSWVHELAHIFRRELTGKELATATVWAEDQSGDIVKAGKWTRGMEESFAEGFERFVWEGKTEHKGMKGIFTKFAEFLRDIYDSISIARKPDLSPEIIGVFDNLLSEERIGELKKGNETYFQIEAWHGTPYNVDRFKTEKIGTGEGHQAFGWGLYYTSEEEIARVYAAQVKDDAMIKRNNKRMSEISKELKQYERSGAYGQYKEQKGYDLKAEYDELMSEKLTATKNLYSVTIHKGKSPSEYDYLEWYEQATDKQQASVKAQAEKENLPVVAMLGEKYNKTTGKELYKNLSRELGSDKDASLFLLRSGMDGIKFPADSLGGARVKDYSRGTNYVVFDEQAITIEEHVLFQKAEQETDIRNLAIHNMQGGSLEDVQSLGGFPMPSFAITREDIPHTGFGEVSLVAPKDMINAMEVWSRDIYSITVPKPEWKTSRKGFALVYDKTKDVKLPRMQSGMPVGYLADMEQWTEDRDSFKYKYMTNETMQLAFLEEQGIEIKIPTEKHQIQNKVLEDKEFLKWIKENKEYRFKHSEDPEYKIVSDKYREVLKRVYPDKMFKHIEDAYFDMALEGDLFFNVYSKVFDEARIVEQKQKYTNRDLLRKRIKRQLDEVKYEEWIEDILNEIFVESRIKVKGRWESYNLSSVVEYMQSQKTRGAEKSVTYGPGKARAMAGVRLDTFKDIKKRNKEIAEAQVVNIYKEEVVDPLHDEVIERIKSNYKWDDLFGGINDLYRSIGTYFLKGKTPNISKLAASLRRYDFTPSELFIDDVFELAEAIRVGQTKYFEGKAYDAVYLRDFAYAVIPDNLPQEQRNYIEDNRIKMVEYEADNKEDRWSKLIAAAEEHGDVLFQPAGDITSDNFKRWFGDWETDPEGSSKVVDESGSPLVVYHTTDKEFEAFLPGVRDGLSGKGIYFSWEPLGQFGSRVIKVYLNIRNPITRETEVNGMREINSSGIPTKFIPDLFEKFPEFDGVINRSEITVKDPSQIKSVENVGTYDPTDSRILYQPSPGHEAAVKTAIEKGQIVPEEVLKEYESRPWAKAEIQRRNEETEKLVNHEWLIDIAKQSVSEEAFLEDMEFYMGPHTADLDDKSKEWLAEFYRIAVGGEEILDINIANQKWIESWTDEAIRDLWGAIYSNLQEARGTGIASGIIASAQRYHGKKAIVESAYELVRTVFKNNPTINRERVARIYKDEDLALEIEEQKEFSSAVGIVDITEPPDITITARITAIEKIENIKLKAKAEDGTLTEGYINEIAKVSAKEVRKLEKQIEGLNKSIKEDLYKDNQKLQKIHEIFLKKEAVIKQLEKDIKKEQKKNAKDKDRSKAKQEALVSARQESRLTLKEAEKKYKDALKSARQEAIVMRDEAVKQQKQKEKEKKDVKRMKDYMRRLGRVIVKPVPASVDFEYRVQIQALQSLIDPKFRSKKTLERLQKSREFFEKNPDAKQFLPAKTLKRLESTSLNNLTVVELESIKDQIIHLKQIGKTKKRLKDQTLKAIARDISGQISINIMAGDLAPEPKVIHGDPRTAKDKFLSGYLKTMRPSRVADMIDGGKEFEGVTVEFFIEGVNKVYNEELKSRMDREAVADAKIKELGLSVGSFNKMIEAQGEKFSVDEVMDIYAGWQNELKRKALQYGNNIDESLAMELIKQLSKEEIQFADWIIDEYEEHFEELNEAFIKYTNNDIQHEHRYTPIVRMSWRYEIHENQIADQMMLLSHIQKKGVKKGFGEKRRSVPKKYQAAIQTGLFATWSDQIEKQEHYINSAGHVQQMNRVLNNSDLKIAAQAKNKLEHLNELQSYVDRFTNPTIYKSQRGFDSVVKRIRNNSAVAYLAFNTVTMVKQLPSLVFYTAHATPGHMLSGIMQTMTDWNKTRAFIEENDLQMKERSIERSIDEIRVNNKTKYDKIIRKVGKVGMKGIMFFDKMATTAGWKAVYDYARSKDLSHEEAVKRARRATLHTQPAAGAKDVASLYADDNFLTIFLQFTNQLNQIWNMATYDAPQAFKNAHYFQGVTIYAGIATSASFIWMISKRRAPEPEDIDDMVTDAFLNIIPFFGPIVMRAKDGWATSPSVLGPFEAAGKAFAKAQKLTKGEELTDKDIKIMLESIYESLAISTGIPLIVTKRAIKAIESDTPIQTAFLGGEFKW